VSEPARDSAALIEQRRGIEAVLMAATEPVEPRLLAELLELPIATVELLCAALAADYEREERGYVLARVAGGYRFQTHPDLAPYVERFVLDRQHARLSNAALETLAIVAYKQPISRAQIASIRGVNVDAVVKTLELRGYITDVARDPGPGQAILYGTTPQFLEQLGLYELADLPALGDFVPGPEVMDSLEQSLRAAPMPVEEGDDSESRDEREIIGAAGPADEIDLTGQPVLDLRTDE
jgi:segregation and condensation protein B